MTTSARKLTGDDLVLSHFTLALDHPLDDRISAAGAAGFAGIGLFAGQYGRLRSEGLDVEQVREWLDEASICIAEVEALSGWAAHAPTDDYFAFEHLVWEVVDTFESRYVQAIAPYEGTLHDAATRFGELCDRAAEHGAVVGLEFLPFTNLVSAADTLQIVQEADRPNGGVCVDIWHHARGVDDLDMIRAIPGELITGIQMSDGPRAPQLDDYKDDCLRNRLPPGTGEFGAVEFVSTLLDAGVDLPWSLEVCNDDNWGRPAAEPAQRAADGMRHVLSEARSPR
ncbi:sugar phosphate isomerase/epimerase family protein [Ilumatobacter coccineus]|uniref:Xylose isomerase-like TIM barrel domain-containing protein n=1 Tax=Ilumatobacter coccineus (strain NBRC 103263 / KCTC 29153 / YM16-304) TaxID=1313172 RepID=A0A6C7EAF4_ILUCY|nr:TIM barrel protein [Ilumatobacter coccineus]BAN03441.1 hypothetical protein YM304_31270 [Ilumatobacter coccineus YM16-304]